MDENNQWYFVEEYTDYARAMAEISTWVGVTGQIRRGNELIYRNNYDHDIHRYPVSKDPQTQAQVSAVITQREDERLAEWRKKHIG